jgi:hypothetical protein
LLIQLRQLRDIVFLALLPLQFHLQLVVPLVNIQSCMIVDNGNVFRTNVELIHLALLRLLLLDPFHQLRLGLLQTAAMFVGARSVVLCAPSVIAHHRIQPLLHVRNTLQP